MYGWGPEQRTADCDPTPIHPTSYSTSSKREDRPRQVPLFPSGSESPRAELRVRGFDRRKRR
jgi:hypothetical protein